VLLGDPSGRVGVVFAEEAMMKVKGIWWALSLAMVAIACGDEGESTGRLRAIASAEPGTQVAIAVDDRTIASGPAEEVLGAFVPVSVGWHEVAVTLGEQVFHWKGHIKLAIDHTVLFGSGLPTVIEDPADDETDVEPQDDTTTLSARFVHGSTTAGLVDVYLSGPDSRIAGQMPRTFDFENGDVTGFETTTPGAYRLRVTRAARAAEVLFDSGSFNLTGTGRLSFVLLDKVGGGLKFLVLTDDGSFPIDAFNPCADALADNDAASARPFVAPLMMDGLCSDGDVDFFKFDLPESKLAVVEVSTAELGSSLSATVELSSASLALDRGTKDAAGKATVRVFLFGGQTYFVKVADAAGKGGAAYTYELRITLLDAAPVVDAAGGNFTAGSNKPSIGSFDGQFVALAAQNAMAQAIDFKSMVRVTGLGPNVYEFVFDPALAEAGVLRVFLSRGAGPLPTVPRSSLAGGLRAFDAFAGWYVAEPADHTTLRARRDMAVAFPNRNISWAVTADPLALPTVTATQLSEARDNVRVTFTPPARATTYEVAAFGRDAAVTGKVTTTQSPVSVPLAGALGETEAFVVRVSAGDAGLIALPLSGQARNVSEFLFYSDVQ
jgi:hypothetical protein